MSLSEVTTIVGLFHMMRGRQFKAFYRGTVCRFMTSEFPRSLSYFRFVALMPRCATVLAALLATLKGSCTGISIADSTPLAVCHNLRIERQLVETVFDELKNLCQIEHTRHRSLSNFAVNLMAGIVAYCLQPVKPRIALRDSRDTLAVN